MGLILFVLGLFKKMLIVDIFLFWVVEVFNNFS